MTAKNHCRVWSSSDGGVTWRRVRPGTNDGIAAVRFADAQHGWLLAGPALETRNGGKTWRAQKTVAAWWTDVVLRDRKVGWAVGSQFKGFSEEAGVILGTRDGGRNWTRQLVIKAASLASVESVPGSAQAAP